MRTAISGMFLLFWMTVPAAAAPEALLIADDEMQAHFDPATLRTNDDGTILVDIVIRPNPSGTASAPALNGRLQINCKTRYARFAAVSVVNPDGTLADISDELKSSSWEKLGDKPDERIIFERLCWQR